MNNKCPISILRLEKGRITALQLAFLIITLVISTADVFAPKFIALEARQDSWIAVIIGTAFSLFSVFLLLSLGLKYPDKTLFQYTCDILGNFLGKIVCFIYLFYFIHIAWTVNRELGEILVTALNPEAPIMIYNTTTVLVAAYAVYMGIEVIARINGITLPIGLAILAFVFVVNLPKVDLGNFLPILYDGIAPPVRGALLIQGWLLEAVLILQLIPITRDTERIKRNTLLSIVVLGISMELGVFTIAIFGPLTEQFLFPALEYVRFASLGRFLENLDISIMGVWIIGIFVKVSLFYYIAVVATAQLFNLKSYKYMIAPVGVLISCLSTVTGESIIDIMHFIHFIFPLYSLTIGFIIPGLLLLVSVIRRKPPIAHSSAK